MATNRKPTDTPTARVEATVGQVRADHAEQCFDATAEAGAQQLRGSAILVFRNCL